MIEIYSPWKKFRKVQVGEHLISVPETPTKEITFPSFLIEGHKVTIPLDELILYRHEKPDGAIWKRDHDIPDFFFKYNPDPEHGTQIYEDETTWQSGVLKSLSYDDTKKLFYYYDREIFRRMYGVHFKNCETVDYLTNDHYFTLQYAKMYAILPEFAVDLEYGRFMEFQRDWAYIMMHARQDPNILGAYCAKSKKTGITQFMACSYLNRSTLLRMRQLGIMSKGNDAADVNMLYYLHAFDGLPMIFKPVIKNRADQAGEIIFGEPPVRNTRTKAGQERLAKLADIRPLNNRVWAAKTKEAGFDSPKMDEIWFDELPKYDTENKQDPEQVFIRNQETVKIQSRITGKIWITSYPPEYDTRGFFQARKIYMDSKLATIKDNPLGRTKSSLICFYISALNSHVDAFDKWGRCDMKKAKFYNDAERNSVKHDKKLFQAKVRQYSETEQECWQTAGAGSTFDIVRLGEMEYDLLQELQAARPFVDGRIEWENPIWEAGAKNRRPNKTFGTMKWIPLTEGELQTGVEGRLRIYHMPAKDDVCLALRMGRDRYGNLLPLPVFKYYGGTDPTEYAAGSEVNEGSKNASFTWNFKDPVMDIQRQKIASGVNCATYFYRPDNPEETYQDMVKEILFFGKRVIVEANKAWMATRLIMDGLGYYMIVRDKKDGLLKPWAPGMVYGLIRAGASKAEGEGEESDHEAIVRAIAMFLVKPPLGEVDYAREGLKDERVIKQLQDFNPKNTKVFDLVMALGYTFICGSVMSELRYQDNSDKLDRSTITALWQALAV